MILGLLGWSDTAGSSAPRRRSRWSAGATLGLSALFLVLSAERANAAPKDDAATKSLAKAMEEDYLDTRFDDAEKRLRGAIQDCGASGCSPAVKAKLQIALGIVLIGGKGKKDEGKTAFIEALKLDKSAAPDPDYVTTEIKAAFEEAKKAAGSSTQPVQKPEPTEGPLTLLPIPAQKVNTPVPLYVTLDDDAAKKVATVVVRYKGTTGDEAELELEKSGKAFRGNVPCEAVAKKGKLTYSIVAKDKKGKEIASLGADSPLSTSIQSDLDGKAPSWPGFAPPEACAGGAPLVDTSGSSHRQCVDNQDCPTDEQCSANECLKKAPDSTPEDKDKDKDKDKEKSDGKPDNRRMNWIRITFAPDFSMISGEDVCGFHDAYSGETPAQPFDETFVCVRNPEGENHTRYLGEGTPGQGNNVNFGFGVATMRLMLSYDRVLVEGLSIGLRLGYAFNGTNEDFASFIPLHVEGKLAYTIGASPWDGSMPARPWVFLSGGLAQVDTAVDVDVLEDGTSCGAADANNVNSPCTIESSDGVLEPRIQTLRAIKQAGLGFIGLGLGVSFVPVDLFEINLGIKFSVTFPYVVPVFSPEIGIGFGF
ncbi:MAG: hypothetical protein U0271_48110 [Polyangiaceae bacterium]